MILVVFMRIGSGVGLWEGMEDVWECVWDEDVLWEEVDGEFCDAVEEGIGGDGWGEVFVGSMELLFTEKLFVDWKRGVCV